MPRLKAFQASIQKRILLFWGYCIRLAHTLFKSNSSAAWFDSKEMFTPVCCNLDNNYYDINIIKQLNTKPAHCHWTFLSLHSFSAGVLFFVHFWVILTSCTQRTPFRSCDKGQKHECICIAAGKMVQIKFKPCPMSHCSLKGNTSEKSHYT